MTQDLEEILNNVNHNQIKVHSFADIWREIRSLSTNTSLLKSRDSFRSSFQVFLCSVNKTGPLLSLCENILEQSKKKDNENAAGRSDDAEEKKSETMSLDDVVNQLIHGMDLSNK